MRFGPAGALSGPRQPRASLLSGYGPAQTGPGLCASSCRTGPHFLSYFLRVSSSDIRVRVARSGSAAAQPAARERDTGRQPGSGSDRRRPALWRGRPGLGAGGTEARRSNGRATLPSSPVAPRVQPAGRATGTAKDRTGLRRTARPGPARRRTAGRLSCRAGPRLVTCAHHEDRRPQRAAQPGAAGTPRGPVWLGLAPA